MPEKHSFKDAEFLTADEKRLVLAAWRRFLKNCCARKSFTKRLYKHLTLHCSFIAHYSIDGFWDYYFSEGREAASLRFIKQFDAAANPEHLSAEMGGSWWFTDERYHDLNSAMVDEMAKHADRLAHLFGALRLQVLSKQIEALQLERARFGGA